MSEPNDSPFYTALLSVLSAASLALSGTSQGTPERALVVPTDPDWDECCGNDDRGRLMVWGEDMFPSDAFPSQFVAPYKCNKIWVVVAAVQVLRCDDVGIDNWGAVSDDALQRQARWLMEDANALAKVVCMLSKQTGQHVAFRGLGTVGPESGCVGVEMRLVIAT